MDCGESQGVQQCHVRLWRVVFTRQVADDTRVLGDLERISDQTHRRRIEDHIVVLLLQQADDITQLLAR